LDPVGNPDDACVDLQGAIHAPAVRWPVGTTGPEGKRRFRREHKASCHRPPGTA
jgi:hypothetical protein